MRVFKATQPGDQFVPTSDSKASSHMASVAKLSVPFGALAPEPPGCDDDISLRGVGVRGRMRPALRSD